jgi:uncharacterized membrane protein
MTSLARESRTSRGWPWLLVAVSAVAIGLFSYRYLIPGAPAASPAVMANAFTRYGVLAVHAGFAATALVLGPWQFLVRLRAARPRLHRWIGRTYAVCSLMAGAAGLVLAFGATTGPVSTAGFGLLALAWIATTVLGWRAARARRFVEHRRWMIRSYALAFAAVTLRIYLPFTFLAPAMADDAYRAISFLCWVPNLAFAEWWLRRGAAGAG